MKIENFEGTILNGKRTGKLSVTLPNEDILDYTIFSGSKTGAIVRTSKGGLKVSFPCAVGPEPKDCIVLSKQSATSRITIQYYDSNGEIQKIQPYNEIYDALQA